MSVSYKKLWKLLIDKDMKKKDLGMNFKGVIIFPSFTMYNASTFN